MANAATNAPLEVTRFAPEGEVALAPNLSVTFSQPMVAVSSQEEAAANCAGHTHAATGRQVALARYADPDVSAGRRRRQTANGDQLRRHHSGRDEIGARQRLRESKTFSFATPPPKLKSSYPDGESKPRDPLMFLEFDQRIEPQRVLEHLKLSAGQSGARLRLATPEEIAAEHLRQLNLVKRAQEGRWLVVRAVDASGATKERASR